MGSRSFLWVLAREVRGRGTTRKLLCGPGYVQGFWEGYVPISLNYAGKIFLVVHVLSS